MSIPLFAFSINMLGVFIVALFISQLVDASTYGFKQRNRETQSLNIWSIEEAKDIGLSWSDDSEPKSLSSIRLSLFSTDGDLPLEPSITTVQNGLNNFLLNELNAQYDWGNQVKQINSKVVTQSGTASSRRVNGRFLQVTGSALDASIEVIFKHDPSPIVDDVDNKVKEILSKDLSFLVKNITEIAGDDPELENLNNIYFIGMVTPNEPAASPVVPPVLPPSDQASTTSGSGISSGTAVSTESEKKQESKQGANFAVIFPIVAASCAVIAAAAIYTHLARKSHPPLVTSSSSSLAANSDGVTNNKEILHTDTGINLFWDGDSDVFSVEAALVESPRWIRKRQSRSPGGRILYRNQDEVSTDQSDIFSGIDFETGTSAVTSVEESPKSGRFENRSVFSFLSGFGSRGEASTVVISNVTKKTPTGIREYSPTASENYLLGHGHTSQQQRASPGVEDGATPRSRVSSLFTFSEEDSTDLYSSGEEKDNAKSDLHRKCLPDFNLLDGPVGDEKLDMLYDDDAVSCLSSSAKNPLAPVATLSPKTETFVMGNESLCSSPRKAIPNESISYLAVDTTDNTQSNVTSINVYDKPTPKFAAVAPSPKESSCFDKPAEECTDANTRWNQFISSFRTDANEKKGPTTSRPKSMIDFNDNSSITDDEGYHTDPGPSAKIARTKISIDPRDFKQVSEVEDRQDDIANVESDDLSRDQTDSSDDPEASPSNRRRSRRHTKNPTGDGTNTYQNDTMGDWSVAEYTNEDASINDTAVPEVSYKRRQKVNVTQIEVTSGHKSTSRNINVQTAKSPRSPAFRKSPRTPKSATTNESNVSGLSGSLSALSDGSGNKQLVSDLVWLEKKINAITTTVVASPKKEIPSQVPTPKNRTSEHSDSLSFNSDDAASTESENGNNKGNVMPLKKVLKSPTSRSGTIDTVHSIVCRDCYAPPGKLKIVIHSTKDGPAVHTVKKGSSLEGHVFPGDLIISVDNVDTRSYSAEQVMKMMIGKTRFERKITVLHFEEQVATQQP
jgi:hypothetical protein